MTNVILDAGTDAKIAKFQRRGLELIDLAFIEPVEVWGEKEGRNKVGKTEELDKRVRRESMRLSVDEAGVVVTNLSLVGGSGHNVTHEGGLQALKSTGPSMQGEIVEGNRSRTQSVTPSAASSALSLGSHPSAGSTHGDPRSLETSDTNRRLHPSQSRASMRSDSRSPLSDTTITPTASSPTPKKNIFGKLFNKRNNGTAPLSSSINMPTPVAAPHSKHLEGFPSFASFSILQAPKTPKAQLMGKQTEEKSDEAVSPTTTVIPTGKHTKGHTKNLSLTGITTPIKATMKSHRNRLSELVSSTTTPLSNTTPPESLAIIEDQRPAARLSADRKSRDASPNPSMAKSTKSRFSWVGTSTTMEGQSTESLGGYGQKETSSAATPQQTYPIIISPSHSEGIANFRQQNQQQLQLRPPVLGIQPTFISAVLPTPPTLLTPLGNVTSPLVSALSPRISPEKDGEVSLQGQRVLMYVWLVRRWLKKKQGTANFGSNAGETVSASGGGVGAFFGKKKDASRNTSDTSLGPLSPPSLPYGGVEVRFEWKRMRGKEAKRNKGGRRARSRNRTASGVSSVADIGAESDGEYERSSRRGREKSRDTVERVKKERKKSYRMSTGSFSTTNMSEDGFGLDSSPDDRKFRKEATSGYDDGEESDPEDSETPWVCTLKIRRTAAAAAGGRLEPTPPPGVIPLEPQVLRIKVGTLSPMPHHPKVVAMLKVPFPLPDVQVERMGVVKRDVRPIGMRSFSQAQDDENGDSTKEPYFGLTLTAEEIKDIVCSTGLWLVVREAFGGIGKVARKGDGWRIRG